MRNGGTIVLGGPIQTLSTTGHPWLAPALARDLGAALDCGTDELNREAKDRIQLHARLTMDAGELCPLQGLDAAAEYIAMAHNN